MNKGRLIGYLMVFLVAAGLAFGTVYQNQNSVFGRNGLAVGFYSFADQGGAVGDIDLNCTIPSNAIVQSVLIDVITACAPLTSSIALKANTAADLRAATTNNTVGIKAGVPVGTAATSVKMTDNRALKATIAGAPLTSGVFMVFCEYRQSL